MKSIDNSHRWIITGDEETRCSTCDCRYGGGASRMKCNGGEGGKSALVVGVA